MPALQRKTVTLNDIVNSVIRRCITKGRCCNLKGSTSVAFKFSASNLKVLSRVCTSAITDDVCSTMTPFLKLFMFLLCLILIGHFKTGELNSSGFYSELKIFVALQSCVLCTRGAPIPAPGSRLATNFMWWLLKCSLLHVTLLAP